MCASSVIGVSSQSENCIGSFDRIWRSFWLHDGRLSDSGRFAEENLRLFADAEGYLSFVCGSVRLEFSKCLESRYHQVAYDAEKDWISFSSSGGEHHSSSNENTTSNITVHAVDDGDDDLREEEDEEPIAPAQVLFAAGAFA